eukprot:gene6246-8604_t
MLMGYCRYICVYLVLRLVNSFNYHSWSIGLLRPTNQYIDTCIKSTTNSYKNSITVVTESLTNRKQQAGVLRQCFDLLNSDMITRDEVGQLIEAVLRHNIYYELSDKSWNALFTIVLQRKLINYIPTIVYKLIDLNIKILPGTINQVLTIMCENASFNETIKILDTLISANIDISIQMFSPLLKSCGSAKHAKSLFQRMHDLGHEINVISCTAAIKSCESTGDWRSALELMDLMRTIGVSPNEITYCCAISVASKGMVGDIAINILREMLSTGIQPNQLCYGATLTACARCNMWDEIAMLMDEMLDFGIQLQETVLSSVINACRNSDDRKSNSEIVPNYRKSSNLIELREDSKQYCERVVWLIDQYASRISNLTESLFTMAMDVAENVYEYSTILSLYDKMINFNVQPSKSSFSFSMRAAVKLMDDEAMLKILRTAQRVNMDTFSMYNSTIVMCDYAGKYRLAIQVYLELYQLSLGLPINNSSYINYNVKGRIPSTWVTKRIISNAIDALTANFSNTFTTIIDGRLAPNNESLSFVLDVTKALRISLNNRNMQLSSSCYAMANKLLLDASDYYSLRLLLNQTISILDVNHSRLYDFAARSLIRVSPITNGLEVLLRLIDDLRNSNNHILASNLMMQGLKRIVEDFNPNKSTTLPVLKVIYGPQKSNYYENLQIVEKTTLNYFKICRSWLSSRGVPPSAYRILIKALKHANLLRSMLEVYKIVLTDRIQDKQINHLIIHGLSKSSDYWNEALVIFYNRKDKPDLFEYSSAITACETGCDWKKAIELMDRMQNHGYNVTLSQYNSIINVCFSCGEIDEVLKLLDLMVNKSIVWDGSTIYLAISSLIKHNKLKHVLMIYDRISPDIMNNIPNNIWNKTSNQENYYQNMLISPEMNSLMIHSYIKKLTYSSLIDAISQANEQKLANKIYADSIAKGLFNPFINLKKGILNMEKHSIQMTKAAIYYLLDTM